MKQNNVTVVFFLKKNALEWETKDITSYCFAAVSTPIVLQDQPVSEEEGRSFKSACVFDLGLILFSKTKKIHIHTCKLKSVYCAVARVI